MNYLLLIVGVLCTLAAFVCLMFCITLWMDPEGGELDTETMRRRRTIVVAILWIVVFATTSASLRISSYLFLTDPQLLESFGWWYFGGLVSRFLALMKRHEVLSSRFSTDWGEVFALFFWAIGGPLVTLHLIHSLIFEKNRAES